MPRCLRAMQAPVVLRSRMLGCSSGSPGVSPVRVGDPHSWSWSRVLHEIGCTYQVGGRVSLGYKPLPAPVAVIPPFLLHAVNVGAVIEVVEPFCLGCTRSGSAKVFPTEAELIDAAGTAVWTLHQERHRRSLSPVSAVSGFEDLPLGKTIGGEQRKIRAAAFSFSY